MVLGKPFGRFEIQKKTQLRYEILFLLQQNTQHALFIVCFVSSNNNDVRREPGRNEKSSSILVLQSTLCTVCCYTRNDAGCKGS